MGASPSIVAVAMEAEAASADDSGRTAASDQDRQSAHVDVQRAPGVDGLEDLGAVDALEVDRGDAEVAERQLGKTAPSGFVV